MLRFGIALLGGIKILLCLTSYVVAQAKSLQRPIEIYRTIESAPISDMLEFFSEKYGTKIRIDEAAFKRPGSAEIRSQLITIPKMDGVSLEFLLEVSAQQIGGTVRRDGDNVVIVPGNRNIATVLGPPSNEFKNKLKCPIGIDRPIDGPFFWDLVEHLSEKADVEIVVAEWQFPPPPKPKAVALPRDPRACVFRRSPLRFSDVRITFPAETRSLEEWLTHLTSRIDGCLIIRDNVILIVRAGKERS